MFYKFDVSIYFQWRTLLSPPFITHPAWKILHCKSKSNALCHCSKMLWVLDFQVWLKASLPQIACLLHQVQALCYPRMLFVQGLALHHDSKPVGIGAFEKRTLNAGLRTEGNDRWSHAITKNPMFNVQLYSTLSLLVLSDAVCPGQHNLQTNRDKTDNYTETAVSRTFIPWPCSWEMLDFQINFTCLVSPCTE